MHTSAMEPRKELRKVAMAEWLLAVISVGKGFAGLGSGLRKSCSMTYF